MRGDTPAFEGRRGGQRSALHRAPQTSQSGCPPGLRCFGIAERVGAGVRVWRKRKRRRRRSSIPSASRHICILGIAGESPPTITPPHTHSGVMMPACWHPAEVAVRIRRLDHVGRADQHAGARPTVLPATLCTFHPPLPPPPHRASGTVWGCARPVASRVRHGEPCVRFAPRRGESPDLWRVDVGLVVCARCFGKEAKQQEASLLGRETLSPSSTARFVIRGHHFGWEWDHLKKDEEPGRKTHVTTGSYTL